jgi:hypothetical protein
MYNYFVHVITCTKSQLVHDIYIINMIYYFVHKIIVVVDNITSSMQIGIKRKVKLLKSF